MTNVDQCDDIHSPPKRKNCRRCVRGGGTFHRHRAECVMPPAEIRGPDGCNAAFADDHHMRKRCMRCVRHNGTFSRSGTCSD